MTVSAVMFEIVEIYIFQYISNLFALFCYMLYCTKTVIYSIFNFAPEIHFFEKIFPVFLD